MVDELAEQDEAEECDDQGQEDADLRLRVLEPVEPPQVEDEEQERQDRGEREDRDGRLPEANGPTRTHRYRNLPLWL
ncbi:MAG TPA: hypothetical protein DCQ64_14640 [Candidatus Rokubacteria bacterium]|nr:hypothetical protein [Candidatus Rokubacteria bacterium]